MLDFGPLRAVLVLRGVLHVEGGEVERDVLGEPILTARAAHRHVAHDDVLKLDGEVLERLVARLTYDQFTLGDMLAVAAVLEQRRTRFIYVLGDAQILYGHFARAGARAHVGRARLRGAPGPSQDVDLVLVLGILSFALDAF